MQRQQALGIISSAAAVIEAVPEALLPPSAQLRALFAALRERGFSAAHLTALLTKCSPAAAADLLAVPAAEVAPRLHALGQLLFVKEEALPAFVAAQPELLAARPEEVAGAAGWLAANLGLSRPACKRHAALLMRTPAELDAAATTLQAGLDCSTAGGVGRRMVACGLACLGR